MQLGSRVPKQETVEAEQDKKPAVDPRGCNRCFGSGLENRFDIDGKIIGVIAGRSCDHRPLEEGEPMFKTEVSTPAEVFPIDR